MSHSISRRSFFRRAAAAPVAGMAAVPEHPKQAWVIAQVNWEYNDEYTYAEGERTLPKVYFNRGQAETECQRLCAKFYDGQTPLDWEVDFGFYMGLGDLPEDCTEETVTWEQLRKAGFPDPYRVVELET